MITLTKQQENKIIRVLGKNYEERDIPSFWKRVNCLVCKTWFVRSLKTQSICDECLNSPEKSEADQRKADDIKK